MTPGSQIGASGQAAAVAGAAPKRFRLESVDVVRGVIMILMALDHTRDFFGQTSISPTDLSQTTISLFFTRWITHFCAPVFFLLTGTGAYLSLRKKSKRQLSRFLFTRGLWLIFLEVVLFRCLGLQFNFDYHLTLLDVLWALGWAMIVLSALVHLPTPVVTGFGVVLIAGHNLLDRIQSANPVWTILHSLNFIVSTPRYSVFVAYTLIPWVGVTAVGYGLGQIYASTPQAWTSDRRRAFLLRAGLGTTAAFVVLRAHQYLRRSIPLEHAEIRGLHRALISEHQQVSAFPAVSSDDARSGAAFPLGGRWRDASIPAARAGPRQSADVLLLAALPAHSSARGRRVFRPLRSRVLDVRVADDR